MAKRITIGWAQYRIIDSSGKYIGMFYLQVRPLLFGYIPVAHWRTLYYFNDFQKAIETLGNLMRTARERRIKSPAIEKELPSDAL